MIDWLLLVVGVLIFLQLFRVNALLRGIYLIIEKQARPAGEESDKWVARLETYLKDFYPQGNGLIYLALGISVIVAVVWWLR